MISTSSLSSSSIIEHNRALVILFVSGRLFLFLCLYHTWHPFPPSPPPPLLMDCGTVSLLLMMMAMMCVAMIILLICKVVPLHSFTFAAGGVYDCGDKAQFGLLTSLLLSLLNGHFVTSEASLNNVNDRRLLFDSLHSLSLSGGVLLCCNSLAS